MSAYKYIYAFTRDEIALPEGLAAVGGGTAAVFEACGVQVICSDTEEQEILSTRRNMMAHTKVLESAMLQTAILPFRFGTIVRSIEDLNEAFRNQTSKIDATLQTLAGKSEVGLKVSWDEKSLFGDIVEADPKLKRLSQEISRKPAAESYYERIDLGQKVEAQITVRTSAMHDRIMSTVKGLTNDAVFHDPAPELGVFNASLLLTAGQENEFSGFLEKLENETGGRLLIKYVSPVPPYNFVDLKVDDFAAAA